LAYRHRLIARKTRIKTVDGTAIGGAFINEIHSDNLEQFLCRFGSFLTSFRLTEK
jgi:hypothetical protein